MVVTAPDTGFAEVVPTINELMPETLKDKLSISLELRYRFEYHNDFDFNSHVDDKDGFQLLRTRLNIDVTPVPPLRLFVQLQDSRIWDSEFTNNAPYEDALDLRQGFMEIRGLPVKEISLRVGRQELSYGDQRLIGGFNWSNVAQSFDAAKMTFAAELFSVDAFAARRVLIDDGNFNNWDDNDNLLGLYASFNNTLIEAGKHSAELYYLFRNTRTPVRFGANMPTGKLNESTVGLRAAGSGLVGFDYTLEAAFQFGNYGSQDIEAQTVNVIAGYTMPVQWSPRVGFELNYASGDDNPTDDTRETFDNLFPTNHLHYGYMDLFSLQNLVNYHLKLSASPLEQLSLQADAHFLFVDETADSYYNAARRAVRTSATTAVSEELGTELDFTVKYKLNRMLGFMVGYSYFFAGDYLKQTGPGDNGEFFYLECTLTL